LAAWTSGTISAKHAIALADLVASSDLDAEQAGVVDEAVWERGGELTVAQARRVAYRAVDKAKPGAANRRHQERQARRSVRLSPQADGMSLVRAELDAVKALTLYNQVTARAESLRAGDAKLEMDQARADALVDLVHTGSTVLAGGSVGSSDDPKDSGDFPGFPARYGAGPQIIVTLDWRVLAGFTQDPAYLHGHGPIPAAQARALAYGPDATWRRLLTDPADPTNLNLGRTTYRPPVGLADYIRARDITCLHPTCNRPARACQLDHNEPFGDPTGAGPGGQTSAENLGTLCAYHHNLKTNGGWEWKREASTGESVWTAPTTKRTYTSPRPTGL
jgi:Domain of unknown function (DUF222)